MPSCQPRKENSAKLRSRRLQILARVQKIEHQGTVPIENRLRTTCCTAEFLYCRHTEPLSGMGCHGSKQVVESPHSSCKLLLCKNPPATQTGETIRFGKTGGDDKFVSKVIGRFWSLLEHCLQIDFINKNPRSRHARDLTDARQGHIIYKRTG